MLRVVETLLVQALEERQVQEVLRVVQVLRARAVQRGSEARIRRSAPSTRCKLTKEGCARRCVWELGKDGMNSVQDVKLGPAQAQRSVLVACLARVLLRHG